MKAFLTFHLGALARRIQWSSLCLVIIIVLDTVVVVVGVRRGRIDHDALDWFKRTGDLFVGRLYMQERARGSSLWCFYFCVSRFCVYPWPSSFFGYPFLCCWCSIPPLTTSQYCSHVVEGNQHSRRTILLPSCKIITMFSKSWLLALFYILHSLCTWGGHFVLPPGCLLFLSCFIIHHLSSNASGTLLHFLFLTSCFAKIWLRKIRKNNNKFYRIFLLPPCICRWPTFRALYHACHHYEVWIERDLDIEVTKMDRGHFWWCSGALTRMWRRSKRLCRRNLSVDEKGSWIMVQSTKKVRCTVVGVLESRGAIYSM